MGLSFLNSAFLGGLSLVSIPIIIHLLQRRRYRVVQWGAMEFLHLSQRNRSRRLMIEQLLLLLIRCLVILVVVLAVCRPVVRSGAAALGGARAQVHAILVLDNSYSMGYRTGGSGGETTFDRAVRRALDLVERGLRQGDGVSVVLASDPPRALVRRASLDLKSVAGLLRRSVSLSDSGTNYPRAARLALEIATESGFPNREVFLIGDNQAAGWEGPGRETAVWEPLSRLARVILLPVREGQAPNAAVEFVRAARGVATVRSATRIQARVANHGRQPLRDVMVSLEVDGKPQGPAQRLEIEPGQGTVVAFNQLFDRPGVRGCTVRIGADRLPSDDVGYLALRVRPAVRVLVLNGRPLPGSPQKDGAFFLQTALSPPLSTPGAEPSALEPQVVAGDRFGAAPLRDFHVVALSDVASLAEDDRRRLAEFVQNGGGALFFLGGRVNAQLYNRDLLDRAPSLLPARLGATLAGRTSLDASGLDHPALERFRGAQDVDVTTAEFQKRFALTPLANDRSVRVVARFTDGSPAMVEKQFGLGRVMLIASTASTEWNTLPLKPVFLPLVHQLVAYLAAGADGTRNGRVGEPLVKPLPLSEAARRITVTGPRGARSTLKPAVDERGATATLEAPREAGFYRLGVEGGETDLFAVNRDTAESDLRALDEAALRRLLPIRGWAWIRLDEDLPSALARSREGVELWRHLLFVALGLMALETMLAQLFGRRA